MTTLKSLVIVISTFVSVFSQSNFPQNLKKCSVSDKQCLLEQIQLAIPVFVKGIPELKLKQIDPMFIKNVKFGLAGLKLNLDDARHTGYGTSKIDDVSIDFKNKVLTLAWHNDATLKGKYQASGRLIVLPIAGDGDFIADFKHINVKLTIPFDVQKDEKDGKERITLKSYNLSFSVKGNENTHYELTNLFNGNKQLADTLKSFIGANGELITNELGKPILDVTIKIIFKQMRKFFDSIPIDDLITRN